MLGAAREFTLDGVYPWGRTFAEYAAMFALTEGELGGRVLSCADGPAGFNAEATRRGGRVTSVDPLYRFGGEEIRRRVEATHEVLVEAARREAHRFVWGHVADADALGRLRLGAMEVFLGDYEAGRREGRYLDRTLPRVGFADDSFDLALCSHFLFLYSGEFDAAFHVASIVEMARVAGEVRVFPLLDLRGERSRHLTGVIGALRGHGLVVEVERVGYEFQRGGNEMLRVRRRVS